MSNQLNAQHAYNELEEMGAPVIDGADGGAYFRISGEDNAVKLWADYYIDSETMPFGVSLDIINVLDKYGLYAEWINPGVLGVYNNG